MEKEPEQNITPPILSGERKTQITILTAPETSLEERIRVARILFTPERRGELESSASKDQKGRPVKYYRITDYDELTQVLTQGESSAIGNPRVRNLFDQRKDEILQDLARKLSRSKSDATKRALSDLSGEFSYDDYVDFLYRHLPRAELFDLQISSHGDIFKGVTGLTSISCGIPSMEPGDPAPERKMNREGYPIIEMVIPDSEIYVNPFHKDRLGLENEKEVQALRLRADWIIDIYQGKDDFFERFVSNPQSIIYPLYQQRIQAVPFSHGRYSHDVHNLIMDFKAQEKMEDVLPVSKLGELDETNPDYQKPLLSK